MDLQPYIEPLSPFQFPDLLHSQYDSLDGGWARRRAATYPQKNTNKLNAYRHIHSSSGIRIHHPSVRAGFCDRQQDDQSEQWIGKWHNLLYYPVMFWEGLGKSTKHLSQETGLRAEINGWHSD
jgi:hypothetical protein